MDMLSIAVQGIADWLNRPRDLVILFGPLGELTTRRAPR